MGELEVARPTDLDAALARKRYIEFKEHVFASLAIVKEKFHFHFVDAGGTKEQVKKSIRKELAYQSAMELSSDTFSILRRFPLSSEIIRNARHQMVARLDLLRVLLYFRL